MSDIIMITFFAIISKATEWKEIESFARKEEKWLKKYLKLPNGIPSHDTIQRVISILDSKVLYENCLKYFIEIIDKYIPIMKLIYIVLMVKLQIFHLEVI